MSESLYQKASAMVRQTWGPADAMLGVELRKGLRALAVLRLLAGQDEAVTAEKVRALLIEAHDLIEQVSK